MTEQLCKRYGATEVLHGIDLRVPAGSLYGFLGPNGAGKTTAIRVLLGLLRASGGRATVLGRDAWRDGPRLRAELSHLPGDIRWYDYLTGKATLAMLDAVRGTNSVTEARRLADVFGLDLGKRVRDFSRGMKQKLGLIQALMHQPKLLVLDEPTASLDPLVRESLNTELRQVVRDGRTVLFSSHSLQEVEALCDWVGILREGRLVEQDRIESLRTRALRRVEITFEDAQPTRPTPDGLHVGRKADSRLEGSWVGSIQPLLDWLAGQRVRDVSITPPDLADLFLAYYSDTEREGAS
ncbi:MAG: ABC transporter ATP-binding protein [bacterium]|nr:ABC transporter ATP-binding protein [bacterium]